MPDNNNIIKTNAELQAFCARVQKAPFITVDTEFLRDKTYYSKLCLIQMSGPDKQAVAIDVLSKDEKLDLQPVWDLMAKRDVLKVFHAARQDMEIIWQLSGRMVEPLFDTQVAAMVCGYGEQIGYDSIVADILGTRPDKSSQFTDWSFRPLSQKQLSYALNDVIHLVDVYLNLKAKLEKTGRLDWVKEEMHILTNPKTYEVDPQEIWQRLKIRTAKPKDLAVIRELAKWRETESQRKDVPRSRVLRDETLLDLGFQAPQNPDDLMRIRGFSSDMARGKLGSAILDVIGKGLSSPPETHPKLEQKSPLPQRLASVVEMLKMLLRIQANENQVAIKLIANSDDIEAFALNPAAECIFSKGWRHDVFGAQAEKMVAGQLALRLENGNIKLIEI